MNSFHFYSVKCLFGQHKYAFRYHHRYSIVGWIPTRWYTLFWLLNIEDLRNHRICDQGNQKFVIFVFQWKINSSDALAWGNFFSNSSYLKDKQIVTPRQSIRWPKFYGFTKELSYSRPKLEESFGQVLRGRPVVANQHIICVQGNGLFGAYIDIIGGTIGCINRLVPMVSFYLKRSQRGLLQCSALVWLQWCEKNQVLILP